MSNTFVISDTHWGHDRIRKLAKRPFHDLHDMDTALVNNWNRVVGQYDNVYCLGDMFWKTLTVADARAILKCLKGRIHLIEGNHNDVDYELRHDFASYQSYLDIKINRQRIIMFHHPILAWPGEYGHSWMLYGHVHQHSMDPCMKGKSANMCVENWNYTPVSFEQLKEYMATR